MINNVILLVPGVHKRSHIPKGVQGRAKRGVWWCNNPHTFLKFVGILTKCVGKFGVSYHKKQNAEFYAEYPHPEFQIFR